MSTRIAAALVALLLAGTSPGQRVSASVTPNPAPQGQPITIAITEANGTGATLPSSCAFQSIHSGSPTGPVVFAPICLLVLTPIAPWGTASQIWTQMNSSGVQVPPGTYWFEVRTLDTGASNPVSDFFCVTIQGTQMDPSLTAGGPAQRGQALPLSISAPNFSNGVYVAAASLTTNTGQTLGPLSPCLDPDPLFALSFPVPDPVLFTGFQGPLDAQGSASGLAVNIPDVPALQCKGLHVQAAVLDPTTSPPAAALTNALSFSIQ